MMTGYHWPDEKPADHVYHVFFYNPDGRPYLASVHRTAHGAAKRRDEAGRGAYAVRADIED